MEFLESNLGLIESLVKNNFSYEQISEELKKAFPEVRRGFSSRNIRLFCAKHSISKRREHEVDSIVQQSIDEVGPTYGRKMMAGYIHSKGIVLSRNQIARSLKRVQPADHNRRLQDTVRQRNPIPYFAPYYGNKLHCDQNEKLNMYGCTFFAFNDGCSSKIIKLFSMPKKNAVVIYSEFRKLLIEEGIWDMLRVDHGTESCLMLFVQDMLRGYRGNQTCDPYVQTRSRENLAAERKWPEINQRVIYPIKKILIRMENCLLIDRHDPVVQFCLSFITMNVSAVGIKRVTAAWNAHAIEGKNDRIPDVVANQTRRVQPLSHNVVPTVDNAIALYRQAGGTITETCTFGIDPIASNAALTAQREEEFLRENPSFETVYNNAVSGDGSLLEQAVLSFWNKTISLSV